MSRWLVSIGLAVGEGFREISTHRFRSFLTISGLILAVGAVIAMNGLTRGMEENLAERLSETGGLRRLDVQPKEPPARQLARRELSPGLTMADVVQLQQLSHELEWVSPTLNLGRRSTRFEAQQTQAILVGAGQGFIHQDQHRLAWGRFLAPLDEERKHRVVVIGHTIARNLFGNPARALGRRVVIQQVDFTVVGVFERYITERDRRREAAGILQAQAQRRAQRGRGSRGGWDPYFWKNQVAVVPLSTAMILFRDVNLDPRGIDQGPERRLDGLAIGVREGMELDEMTERIRQMLLRSHRGIEDFEVISNADRYAEMRESLAKVRIQGWMIAGIGLLVGGLGVMNIMLASLADRVRDIGIRRALGARRADVFIQVAVESFLLGVVGGIFGLLAGWGMVNLLQWLSPTENRIVIEPMILLTGLAFSVATGTLAGLFPSWQASRLSPLDALRFE